MGPKVVGVSWRGDVCPKLYNVLQNAECGWETVFMSCRHAHAKKGFPPHGGVAAGQKPSVKASL